MWNILKVSIFVILVLGVTSCSEADKARKNLNEQKEDSLIERTRIYERAQSENPVPVQLDLPRRDALIDYVRRTALTNHQWYIYILGDNGNIISYYVAKTDPISTCTYLQPTPQDLPALDGLYYSGSGSGADCGWFFFDYATDALIALAPGIKFFAIDQPLEVDAEPIEVQTP